MEFSTKQNLEWNMGGVNGDRVKKKKDPSLLLYFYFIAPAPGLWSYSPRSIQWNCIQSIPLVSFVNMCPRSAYERMAHFQNLSSCSFKYCSILSSPCYSLPHTSSPSVRWMESRALVAYRMKGAYFCHKSSQEGRGLWGATGEVWTHLPLIILPVRGFSLDLWTSELPHTTNLLINREIPWKNFEASLCVCVCVFTWVCVCVCVFM